MHIHVSLKDILEELSQTSVRHSYSDAGNQIIANIKSTMSKRPSSQKAFNILLSEYLTNILLLIIFNWDGLEEYENIKEALRLFENANGTSDNESCTVRLVRTAYKHFSRRVCETSGCPLQFSSYLKQQGIN